MIQVMLACRNAGEEGMRKTLLCGRHSSRRTPDSTLPNSYKEFKGQTRTRTMMTRVQHAHPPQVPILPPANVPHPHSSSTVEVDLVPPQQTTTHRPAKALSIGRLASRRRSLGGRDLGQLTGARDR